MPSDLMGPRWEPFDGRVRCEVDHGDRRYLVVHRPDAPPSAWRTDRALSSVMGRSPEHRHGIFGTWAAFDGTPTVVVVAVAAAAVASFAVLGRFHPSNAVGFGSFVAALVVALAASWAAVIRSRRNWCRVQVTKDSLLYTTYEMACKAERDAIVIGDAAANPQQIRAGLWAGLWAVAVMHARTPAGDPLRRREAYDAAAALHHQVSAINHRLEAVARQYAERLQCGPDLVLPRMRDSALDAALSALADAERGIVGPPPPGIP